MSVLPLMRFYSTREEAAADAAKTDFKSQPLEAFDFVCISLKPYRIQFFRCVEKLFVVGPRLGMSLSDSISPASRNYRASKAGYCGLQSEKHLSVVVVECDLMRGVRAGKIHLPPGGRKWKHKAIFPTVLKDSLQRA